MMRLFHAIIWSGLFAACWLQHLGSTASAADLIGEQRLRDGDTIVFFGDSITQGGGYIDHFEAYLLCRYPSSKFRVLNRGLSSETISGTSEPDHSPRRPWAHDRFSRDITPLQPDVLIACYGMNDGNYHPFDWPRFDRYQAGIRRLIERAHLEAHVRTLILMTPTMFDGYQRKSSDPAAQFYGYKFPATDYDATLGHYADWLRSLTSATLPVVDQYTAFHEHTRRRREERVSFTLAPDAVHPNATGHWLMALSLVRQLALAGATPETAVVNVDADAPLRGTVSLSGLAPHDPQVEAASLDIETAAGNPFTWQRLQWPGLEPHLIYELLLDDRSCGQFPGSALLDGVAIRFTPEHRLAQQRAALFAKVRERRQLEYSQYRAGTDLPLGNPPPAEGISTRLDALTAEIEKLRGAVTSPVQLKVVESGR